MRKTITIFLLVSGVFAKAEAQKGEKSIAAGLLINFPESRNIIWNPGVGLEGIGQYNFTKKSAALLQLQLTWFREKGYYNHFSASFIGISLKGGYRYQFTTSGFYANVLTGLDQDSDGGLNTAAVLGLGKRFAFKDVNFIDVGLDYIIGDLSRINIKALFSLLRRAKDN